MLAQAKVVVHRHNCHNTTKKLYSWRSEHDALFIIAKDWTRLWGNLPKVIQPLEVNGIQKALN